MSKKIIFQPAPGYQELLSIPAGENHEALVDLGTFCSNILCQYNKRDMLTIVGNKIFVRLSVAERLFLAACRLEALRPGYQLKIVYGYRHPNIQKKYFQAKKAELHRNFPMISGVDLIELTHSFVAEPSVAGHPTGGAIDLTIINNQGQDLKMGTEIADYSDPEKIRTFCKKISKRQAANRRLLLGLMLDQGFAPFFGEWWHFSYGDIEWAFFNSQKNSLYSRVNLKIK
ncbi:MAG: M15 family metallopeptidase [Patescibacteria group bacterium]|jgi:D-alanyl-D-alanine dipeptidase